MEYGQLKKRYWGGHLWAIGFGAWSTGTVTKEMINEYIAHHAERPNHNDNEEFVLEGEQ